MELFQCGLQIPSYTFAGVSDAQLFERISQIASTAEQSGFDALFLMDHYYQIPMIGPKTDPMFEAYTMLGAIAARTSSISLGTMVTGVTYRNPAQLAKSVTTLDVISQGRAILGIGAAWHDVEHEGYGYVFPPVAERMDRLEEALKICRAMFTEEEPSFSGKHYQIDHALNFPRPIRPDGIPILVGGGGERRTLALVARYANACNLFGDADTVRAKLAVLDRHCEAIGRDPASISRTRLGTLVIAPTEKEAMEKGRLCARVRNMDEERFQKTVTVGDPEHVIEQVGVLREAGLDGLVFNVADVDNLESVALAGETLRRAFPTLPTKGAPRGL